MINKDTLITVTNKYNGTVGYDVPDLMVHREFYPGEHKEITFEELEKLSFAPGGDVILNQYLEIDNKDAVMSLFGKEPEPEYYYTKADIKELMLKGSLDQFLDCLDFAPESVKEIIKDLAVELPLNDVAKRDAIRDKMGFDVSKAIEIKNTKFDGGDEDTSGNKTQTKRRAPAPKAAPAPSGRRYTPTPKE